MVISTAAALTALVIVSQDKTALRAAPSTTAAVSGSITSTVSLIFSSPTTWTLSTVSATKRSANWLA